MMISGANRGIGAALASNSSDGWAVSLGARDVDALQRRFTTGQIKMFRVPIRCSQSRQRRRMGGATEELHGQVMV